MVFTCAARESACDNGCEPLPKQTGPHTLRVWAVEMKSQGVELILNSVNELCRKIVNWLWQGTHNESLLFGAALHKELSAVCVFR